MAENKKSFLLHCDLLQTVKKLPLKKAGELFIHILEYVNDLNPETDDLLLQVAFEPVKQSLKRDLKKWEEKSSARSEAGKAGMQSKWGESNHEKRSQRLKAAREKGTHTKEEWEELLLICNHGCVKCGSDVEIVKDHIIPIYQGGSDGIDNLQPLCKSCNSAKGADNTNYILKMPNKCLTNYYQLLTKITVSVNDSVNVSVSDIKEINKENFCDLNADELNTTVEYMQRTHQLNFSYNQLQNFFPAFKIQYGKDFYPNRQHVIKHFRNWLKQQKNGKQNNSAISKGSVLTYDRP